MKTKKHKKGKGTPRDSNGMQIEDFGHTENLMIAESVEGFFYTVREAVQAVALSMHR